MRIVFGIICLLFAVFLFAPTIRMLCGTIKHAWWQARRDRIRRHYWGYVALLLLPLCGCMNLSIPRTTITGTINGQPFSLSSPKDSELQGLSITASSNSVCITVQSLKATMNPANIQMTGDAQAKIITAVASGVANAMGTAAGAAAASTLGR